MVAMKKFLSIFLSTLVCSMFICGCQNGTYLEPPNMDVTMDFALVGDNLIYCTEDGIYRTNLKQTENDTPLLLYPEDYVKNLPASRKPNVYIDQSTETPVLNVSLFRYYGFPLAINLKQTIATETPEKLCLIGEHRALYRDFGNTQAYLVWSNQFVGPNAVYVTHEETETVFHESPYLFGYNGLYPNMDEHNRLEHYQNKLYCLVSKYLETENNYPNLYELDYVTKSVTPFTDYIVDDFVVDENHLYFLSGNLLYHYNLDSGFTEALTEAKNLSCTDSVQDFLCKTSQKTANCSLVAIGGNIFYVNTQQNLCCLHQENPIYTDPICFLQQQENYLVAILQIGENAYKTVVIDANGTELLSLTGINRLSIEDTTVVYSDGKHLYNATLS